MNFLIMLTLISFAFGGPRNIASEAHISGTLPADRMNCLKSLSEAPETPEMPKLYFQTLEGKEVFNLRCHMSDAKENARFLFLTDDGVQVLKLPIFHYTHRYANGDGDATELPRNVIHFRYLEKDYYLELQYADVAHVITSDRLPEVAGKLQTSVAKIQSEYVKKYETWLKAQGKEGAFELKVASEDDLSFLMPCLEAKELKILDFYLGGKYRKTIPPYGTIIQDSRNYHSLKEDERKKYQKPWNEIEKEVLNNFKAHHPLCEGVFSKSQVKETFDKNFGKSKTYYENLREIFYP